jgi:hypothetical protein
MLQKYSNKKKANYLIIGFLIAIMLVYSLAIKRTINEYSTCKTLQEQLKGLEYAPTKIAEYEQKINYIESSIGASSTSAGFYQEQLLSLISKHCKVNNLTLSEMPEPYLFQQKNLQIETYPVTIQGTFIPMLKLMHYIEANKKYGRVISARFYKKRDNETEKVSVFMTLYIQHVKKEQL